MGQGGSGSVPQLTNFSAERNYIGAYIQDDWKVTPKLTLSAGVRYEIQTAPTERYNQQGWFDYSAINPISNMVNPTTGLTVAQMLGHPVYGEEVQAGVNGAGRGLFNVQYNNFAPRFALAYSPGHKFVIRSGFAIFYVPDFVFPGSGYNAPGYSANSQWNTTQANGAAPGSVLSNPFPNGLTQEVGSSLGPLVDVGNGATEGYSHWRPTPYVEQWSFGVQYQTTKNSLLDLEYIGNHGLKLPTAGLNRDTPSPTSIMANQANLNNLVPNPFYGVITSSACNLNAPQVLQSVLLNPYPQYCGITESQAEVASSWYEALQAKFTQRWSGGLQMLASFTWSKYLDNSAGVQGWTNYASQTVPNPYDLKADKSYDINDIPLAFTASFVYDLPIGKGRHFGHNMNSVANAIVGGWQVSGIFSAHDGFPLSVETSAPGGSLGVYEGGLVRPNVICNPTPANRTWNNFINPACFAEPVANYSYASLGNAPATEGYFRGPGFVNLDIALHKNWYITERLRTEFRAEAFNVANHVNFFAPGGGSLFWYPGYTANVANLTGSYPARNVQLALKLLW